jgi:hypothetical protein
MFRIPLDFWDLEQAWEQVIFEKGEYVYILEGDADDHACGCQRLRNLAPE